MKLGYGELALEGNRRDMAEINLWALIVVKLSELGILKRYIIYILLVCTGHRTQCQVYKYEKWYGHNFDKKI